MRRHSPPKKIKQSARQPLTKEKQRLKFLIAQSRHPLAAKAKCHLFQQLLVSMTINRIYCTAGPHQLLKNKNAFFSEQCFVTTVPVSSNGTCDHGNLATIPLRKDRGIQ